MCNKVECMEYTDKTRSRRGREIECTALGEVCIVRIRECWTGHHLNRFISCSATLQYERHLTKNYNCLFCGVFDLVCYFFDCLWLITFNAATYWLSVDFNLDFSSAVVVGGGVGRVEPPLTRNAKPPYRYLAIYVGGVEIQPPSSNYVNLWSA